MAHYGPATLLVSLGATGLYNPMGAHAEGDGGDDLRCTTMYRWVHWLVQAPKGKQSANQAHVQWFRGVLPWRTHVHLHHHPPPAVHVPW